MSHGSGQSGPTDTAKTKMGRRPRLSDEERLKLFAFVEQSPAVTYWEMVEWVGAALGKSTDRLTLYTYLKKQGIHKRRPQKTPFVAPAPDVVAAPGDGSPTKRYGYKDYHRSPDSRTTYPSSLTDAEWALVGDLFQHQGGGKKPRYDRRVLVDAVLFAVRGGVSWRMLPKEFPPWQNVYATFQRWSRQGVFEAMYDRLRAMARERAGKPIEPTAAILDSQSTRTSPQGGPKGYDAGKKISGRKRHLVVDTMGLLLAVLLTPANVQDRDAVGPVFAAATAKYQTITTAFVDAGYAGQRASAAAAQHGVRLEVVRRQRDRNGVWTSQELPFEAEPQKPFRILPKRWIVERNNAWDERPRRMNRDHDRLLSTSTA